MNREFLKEAISDAKTMKESAIANAKVALEEAFSPQLQSMFASKIEEMDNMEMEEGYDEMEEAKDEAKVEGEMSNPIMRTGLKGDNKAEKETEYDREVDEDMDLDEILAELENELEESTPKRETLKEEESDEDAEEEGYLDGMEDEKEDVEGEDDEEIDLEEMSEDDLKDFIEDVIADMVTAGELEAGDDFEVEDEDEDEEVEVEVEDEEDIEVEDEVEVTVDEDVSKRNEEVVNENLRKDLKEAMNTVVTLKTELNEINLLNAKLLYVNKIYKTKNLNESQKAKVLGAFDKASTVKEVKIVFNTINENFTFKKKTVNESRLGSASKSVISPKVTKKKPIVESDEMVNRFQKLAGIIK
jgi:hypothetical protein|tara:strand:+ start:9531 stop:10604 length:1074 start_codon:yes stop_codon:yes gene_type:complete